MDHTDAELSVGVRTLDLQPAVRTPALALTGMPSPLELRALTRVQLTATAVVEAS